MKALKVTVVALLIVIAGLLVVIHRLTTLGRSEVAAAPAITQSPSGPMLEPVTPAPATPSAASASPAGIVRKQEKPFPIHKRVMRPRAEAAAAAAVQDRPIPVAAAASAPAPTERERPAEPAPVVASAAAPAPPTPVVQPTRPAAPTAPRHVTIPAGTAIVIRTQNTLSTARNRNGDSFAATLDEPIAVDGLVIAEKGAEVEGTVVRSQPAGRVEGVSELGIELVRVHSSDGQRISIATDLHDIQGQRSRGRDAEKVGAATGIGAIIGAIAGGGKGAAIGAGVGAGAGGGAVLATRGKDAAIPSESRIIFHTRTPVSVTERP